MPLLDPGQSIVVFIEDKEKEGDKKRVILSRHINESTIIQKVDVAVRFRDNVD